VLSVCMYVYVYACGVACEALCVCAKCVSPYHVSRVPPVDGSVNAPDPLVVAGHRVHLRLTTTQLPPMKQLNLLGGGCLTDRQPGQEVVTGATHASARPALVVAGREVIDDHPAAHSCKQPVARLRHYASCTALEKMHSSRLPRTPLHSQPTKHVVKAVMCSLTQTLMRCVLVCGQRCAPSGSSV